MPRRAKSGITGSQITLIALVVIAGFVGGYFLLTRSKDPFVGLNTLPIASYLDEASRMRGNQFKVKGTIEARLDKWGTDEGRVFSFMVDDGFKRHPIAIHIPPQLNEKYLTRGQEYMLRVKIGDNGILVVEEISNT